MGRKRYMPEQIIGNRLSDIMNRYLRLHATHLFYCSALCVVRRHLLACLKRPEVRQGRWQLLEVRPAWDGNHSWDRFLAFAWEDEAHQRLLVAVNYGPSQGQCHVAWPFVDMKGKKVALKDLMYEARYEWEGDAFLYRGLYVDLPSWGFHVFAWQGGAF